MPDRCQCPGPTLPACTRHASGFTHLPLPVAPKPLAGPCARYAGYPKPSRLRMRPLCQPPRPAWGGAPEAPGGTWLRVSGCGGASCGAPSLAPSPIGNRDATPFLIIAVIIVVSKVLEPQARWRFPATQPRAGPGDGGGVSRAQVGAEPSQAGGGPPGTQSSRVACSSLNIYPSIVLSFARLIVQRAGKQLQLEGDETKIRFKRQMAFKGINAGIPNTEMVTGRKEIAGKQTHRGP